MATYRSFDMATSPEVFWVSANVVARRLELGITQADLATQCNVSVPYLSALENNKASPTLEVLIKLSRALDITVAKLVSKPPKRRVT